MKRRKNKRSWLIIKPMSSFNSGSERSSISSQNFVRSSTYSDYTHTEYESSNYKHNKIHQNLNLNLLVSHIVYYINIQGRVSRTLIKVKQSSLFKIFLLIKKPWNTIFELLKLNFNQEHIKNYKKGDIAIYNKLLNSSISFFQVKFIKSGNEIDICNNSLIEIIRKINSVKFEIGEFLDIIITNEKLSINTPFHQLISRKSLNLGKNKYKKSKTFRNKKLTFDHNDMYTHLDSSEIVFDEKKDEDIKNNDILVENKLSNLKNNDMIFDDKKINDKKNKEIIEEKEVNNKEENNIIDDKKIDDKNNKDESKENKKKGKKVSKKKKQKTIEENTLNDNKNNSEKTIEENTLNDNKNNIEKTIEENTLNDNKNNDEKDGKKEENKVNEKKDNDKKTLKGNKKKNKKVKEIIIKENKLNNNKDNITNEMNKENSIENNKENNKDNNKENNKDNNKENNKENNKNNKEINIENNKDNNIEINKENNIDNNIEINKENNIDNNIEINRESEKMDNENITNKRENIVEFFLKKERKKRKKKKEEFPFEAKPKDNIALSAVNIPINHHKPNKSISFFPEKSFISQDDLDDLRKDFFEKPITIRRIIYKVIKKKIKKK